MLTLRPYQIEAIASVRAALRKHDAVLLQSPTGSGKTVTAAQMAANAFAKNHAVWFLVHRDFLIEQTSAAFDLAGVPHTFIAAGRQYNPFMPAVICSVQTLTRRLARHDPPAVIIWDEAHHISAASWSRIFEWARGSKHIGLTATPMRLDGRGLDRHFQCLIPGPSVEWLIEQGFLSRYKAYSPGVPDLSGIHSRAGDYMTAELESVMDGTAIMGDLVRHYRTYANGLRAVYFGVSVRHSEHIAATFNASGIPALHLDGESSTDDRMEAARRFAAGEIQVLSNVDLFGEGYDLAAQAGRDVTVDCVGLARPTQSLGLHLQQVGRCLRPKPTPAVILDHSGNCLKHGLPDDEREWTLAGREKGKRQAETAVQTRMCMACFGVFRAGPAKCPLCGAALEIMAREVEHVEGKLEEISKEELARRRARQEVGMAKTKADLERIARERGYKMGWVEHMLRHKSGREEQIVQSYEQMRMNV